MANCRSLLAFFVALSNLVQAEGIIGGTDDYGIPYAARVLSSGVVQNLPTLHAGPTDQLPALGNIVSVAYNSQGKGLIGGQDHSAAYVALVLPSGTLQSLPKAGDPLPSPGYITRVVLNNQDVGLIGGQYQSGPPYAALLFPSGVILNLPNQNVITTDHMPVSGTIASVALNSQGLGLIGGQDQSGPAYASIVFPSGSLYNLENLPSTGAIITVALNTQGAGLIGGIQNGSAYAALVSLPSGAVQNLPNLNAGQTDSLPSSGIIVGAALNSKGVGLIGGQGYGNAYAALISPSGTLNNLSLPFTTGEINQVALNDEGIGLIGGSDLFTPYAALVFSSAKSLQTLPTSGDALPLLGHISSVTLNNQGVGIIGGTDTSSGSNVPYAALVSPSGALTMLPKSGGPFPISGSISSVATADAVVPTSIGPYDSAIQTLLATSFAYESHVTAYHKSRSHASNLKGTRNCLANGEGTLTHEDCVQKPNSCSLWIAPFAEISHERTNTPVTNKITGALIGLDYEMENCIAGGGLAYAFDDIHYPRQQGHAKINEELALLYVSFRPEKIFINTALYGGLYQVENRRQTLGIISSKSHTHGWLLSPHVEISTIGYQGGRLSLEPFVMCDWVNSWQTHFTERGKSGFNLVMPNIYSSLLRSEVGLRFYERVHYTWGDLVFEEKVSYINQAPFHTSPAKAAFIGSFATFDITTRSHKVQNLAGLDFHCFFLPSGEKYPYGSLNFQGQLGSAYRSYFVGAEIGKKF